MKKIIILLVLTLAQKTYCQEIKIICTAALIDQNFEERKIEYINSLEVLSSYGYSNPYVIEAIKSTGPTFLDNYSCKVIYTKVNNSNLHNKGVNEAKSILEALKYLYIDDNDMLIKITGRYFFTSNAFLTLVKESPGFDGFIKTDSHNQVFTGCFALRYKHFKEFLYQLNLEFMENNMINIEWELAQYINSLETNQIKIMKVENLGITANIFGNGNPILTYW